MALITDRDRSNIMCFRFLDGKTHCSRCDHESKAPISIDPSSGRGLMLYLERSPWDNLTQFDSVDIDGGLNDSMGVMTREISLNEVSCHYTGFIIGCLICTEDMKDGFLQVF